MNTPVTNAVKSGLSAAQSPREEDSRARAARRAMELRDHLGNMDDGEDKFFIDPKIIPDGWSYEWKRFTVLNQEDPSYQVSIAQRGWESVPRSRHPHLMPESYRGETILREGMILMERPAEITNEVRANDQRKARMQVRNKEEQLNGTPAGTLPRDADPRTRAVVKRTYEAGIQVPEK